MPENMRKSRRMMWFVAALIAALALRANVSRAQGPTDQVANCIDAAAQEFSDCVYDHAWYVAPLCAVRYASDTELCLPKLLIK